MPNSYEEFMYSFRERTGNFSGDTVEAKTKNLISRWSKVIEDCKNSSDSSIYRKKFREVHAEYIEGMDDLIGKNEQFIISNLQSKKDKLKNFYLLSKTGSPDLCDGSGTLDAIGYIIAEIESILETNYSRLGND
jgi:hypothetical protein